jgi:hypothetical protein
MSETARDAVLHIIKIIPIKAVVDIICLLSVI